MNMILKGGSPRCPPTRALLFWSSCTLHKSHHVATMFWFEFPVPSKRQTRREKSNGPTPKKTAQVRSPTACGALCSARTTPQPSQNLAEPSWNPGGTLVEPCLRAAPDHPEPIWAETPKRSAVGKTKTRTLRTLTPLRKESTPFSVKASRPIAGLFLYQGHNRNTIQETVTLSKMNIMFEHLFSQPEYQPPFASPYIDQKCRTTEKMSCFCS